VPQKNYPLLLDVTERIARRRPFRLIVLGRGPERDRLRQEAQRRGLAVDFRGYEANPYGYMARADVFLVASHEEGFGLGLVEAMACGTPAISTATSGSQEILCGGAGMIVSRDPAVIADAALKVLEDGALRASLKEKGLERAAEFTPQRVAERWLAFAAGLR
jgi:glycosyltransferase involved in cell wall biosynthesis